MKTTSSSGSGHAGERKRSSLIAPPQPRHSNSESVSRRKGKRILLVDDDPTVRESLRDVFVSEGHTVITAENGQQALDLVTATPVDLVLLDLNMPVKNGWDTFERLSAEHPLVAVIVITARSNQLFTAIGAGVGALLEKPMDIRTLLRTVEKLLAEPREQRLARLAGKATDFYYAAPSDSADERPS